MADLFKAAKQCLEDGELEQAMKKAEEALAKFKSSGDADGMADVVKTLVAAHIAVDKLEDAKLAVKDVLAQFKTSGNKAGQAAMLLATGELSCADKDADKALALVPEIKALTPGAGGKSNELEAQLLNLQVNANLVKGSPSDAMVAAREMRALATKNSDKEGEANAWHAIASVYHMQETDDTDRATPDDVVQAAEKAASLYKEAGKKNSEATAMNTIANAQLRMDKPSLGLKTAQDALSIFKDLQSTRGMVKSLEIIVQANILQDNPMAGLQAANKELTAVKTSGNQRGEVDLLEMIAGTHAMLNQPHSALKFAGQASDIFAALGDNMGQGNMCLLQADMYRALATSSAGAMGDATKSAEKALKFFRAAGSKWGEEQALQSISSLLVDRGQPEKAPKRGEAQKALKELQKAIEMRKVDDIKSVEEKLNKLGNLVSDADIQGILSPVLLKDPSALEFLEEQGWQFKKEGAAGGGATKIKQYPHKGFYLHMIMTGMNFGPQFRVVNPYRVGDPGKDCTCVTVSQLPETEAWQMEMGYRPGMLDSGLQCQAMQAFP
mmetsp:Transcript_53199/g.106785  ORF Transcript_53199/g.106785 Transcript_53199/m.106785 type:complete len:553 (-) Transcript_53199:176-1834(-)